MKIDNNINKITCTSIDASIYGRSNTNSDANVIVVGSGNTNSGSGGYSYIAGANNTVYTGSYSVVLGSGLNISEYADYRVIVGCYENYTFYDQYSGAVDFQKNIGYQVKENRSLTTTFTPREIVYQSHTVLTGLSSDVSLMEIPTLNNQSIGVCVRCVIKTEESSAMSFSVKNALYSHIGGSLTYVGVSSELGVVADGNAYIAFTTNGDNILITGTNSIGSNVEFNLHVRVYTVLEYIPSGS